MAQANDKRCRFRHPCAQQPPREVGTAEVTKFEVGLLRLKDPVFFVVGPGVVEMCVVYCMQQQFILLQG